MCVVVFVPDRQVQNKLAKMHIAQANKTKPKSKKCALFEKKNPIKFAFSISLRWTATKTRTQQRNQNPKKKSEIINPTVVLIGYWLKVLSHHRFNSVPFFSFFLSSFQQQHTHIYFCFGLIFNFPLSFHLFVAFKFYLYFACGIGFATSNIVK